MIAAFFIEALQHQGPDIVCTDTMAQLKETQPSLMVAFSPCHFLTITLFADAHGDIINADRELNFSSSLIPHDKMM